MASHATTRNAAHVCQARQARLHSNGIGSKSEWEYYNSDHAFLAGKKAAKTLMGDRAAPVAATVV